MIKGKINYVSKKLNTTMSWNANHLVNLQDKIDRNTSFSATLKLLK